MKCLVNALKPYYFELKIQQNFFVLSHLLVDKNSCLPTAGDVFASKQLTFSHALNHFQGNRFAPSLIVLAGDLTGLLVSTGCAVIGVVHPGVFQCLLKKNV